eukprot:5934165-Prymnesium_polylepis.1
MSVCPVSMPRTNPEGADGLWGPNATVYPTALSTPRPCHPHGLVTPRSLVSGPRPADAARPAAPSAC